MKRFYNYLLFLILFVPPLIFFTDLTRNPYYFQIVLVNAAVVVLWMAWLYRETASRKCSFLRTPLDIPLLSFAAVATLSWLVILLGNLGEPYLRYGVYNEGLKRWLFLLSNCLLVYYAAVHFVNDTNRPRFIHTVYWVTFIASAYAILQYFGIELIWPRVLNPFGGRSVSTFGNPNFLSSYLVLVSPLMYLSYLQENSSSKRFIYLVLLASSFAALLCTLTRSSWLGLVIAMALTVAAVWKFERTLFTGRIKSVFLPFVLFLLLAIFWPKSRVAGYGPSVIERLTESAKVETTYYAPWHQRQLIWSCAWHMAIENPVIGKGWGCFELFYPFYQGRHLFLESYHNFRTHANNTHNELLEIWSQTGTLGMGVYLWFLVTVYGYGYFLMKNLTGQKRLLAIGLTASLAGMWTDNLLNVSLHFAIPAFLYWWHMGLLAGLGRVREQRIDIGTPARRGVAWALIIAGGLLIVHYGTNFLGEIHYFKGFKNSKTSNVQAALPDLERAHRYQRLEVNNNYELANAYARSGLRDKALYAYKETLRANAGYDEIYFNMATVLAQKGDFENAIAEYTRSLYINPQSIEAYNALGTVFLQNPEKYARAGIALFQQCLHFYPKSKDIWNNIGYLYTRVDRNDEALQAYKKAYEIDPDFDLARRNIKVTLERLGKTDSRIDETDALFKKVEQNIVAKDWAAAAASCERLLKIAPASFKARFYMGNIYFTNGQIQKAIDQYNEGLKIEPNNSAMLGNLGLVYYETRQYDLSRKTFQKLLQLDPNNQLAKQKLDELSRQPQ